MFGYPSQKTFKNMVRTINNCPVTTEGVCNTNTIYGCGFLTLKGKTVLQQPKHVQAEYIEVPDSLRERIGSQTVEAEVIFVNGIRFVFSVSREINFTTVEYVRQRLKIVLVNSIGKIFHFYKNNRYTIKNSLIDRNFECIRDSLPGNSNLNITARYEHVEDIEYKNCVIKEIARELIIKFPFKKVPVRIIIGLIRFVGIFLNQESLHNGASDVYYPRNIIMSQYIVYDKHFKFIFGSLC